MGGVGVNTGSGAEALPANLPAKLWVGWVLTQGLGQKLLTCQAVGGMGVNTGSGAEALPANLPAMLWEG